MSKDGLMEEYENIMLGHQKDFPASCVGSQFVEQDAVTVLRYAFEQELEWDPETVRDFLSWELLDRLHLTRLVKNLKFPQELDSETDLFYVAWLLYPTSRNFSRKEMVLNKYQKVLNGNLCKYPKGFFISAEGMKNAGICLRYAIDTHFQDRSLPELYSYFNNQRMAMRFLREVNLDAPCLDLFGSPLEMLHDSLPKTDEGEFYYHYERFRNELNAEKEKINESDDQS